MMYYGGMNAAWVIFCVVAVVAIIALVAWAIVSTTSRRDMHDTPRDETLTILQRRYANGEIDEQEYTRRREVLAQH